MTGSERGRVFNGPWRKHLVGSCRSGKDRRIGNGQEKENDEKIDRSKTPTDDLSVNLFKRSASNFWGPHFSCSSQPSEIFNMAAYRLLGQVWL